MATETKRRVAFSVVIPTHDRPELLVLAIRSVLRGIVLPEEIIVVDDSRSADTREAVRAFNGRTPVPVRYLERDIGEMGPGLSRQLGSDVATAEWIAYLDDDDLWFPTHLSEMTTWEEQTDHAALATDRLGFRHDLLTATSWQPFLPPGSRFEMFALGSNFGGSNIAVRSDAISSVRWSSLPSGEDRELLLRLETAGYSIGHVNRTTTLVREHPMARIRDSVHRDHFLERYSNQAPLPARWHRKVVSLPSSLRRHLPASVLGAVAWGGSAVLALGHPTSRLQDVTHARARRRTTRSRGLQDATPIEHFLRDIHNPDGDTPP